MRRELGDRVVDVLRWDTSTLFMPTTTLFQFHESKFSRCPTHIDRGLLRLIAVCDVRCLSVGEHFREWRQFTFSFRFCASQRQSHRERSSSATTASLSSCCVSLPAADPLFLLCCSPHPYPLSSCHPLHSSSTICPALPPSLPSSPQPMSTVLPLPAISTGDVVTQHEDATHLYTEFNEEASRGEVRAWLVDYVTPLLHRGGATVHVQLRIERRFVTLRSDNFEQGLDRLPTSAPWPLLRVRWEPSWEYVAGQGDEHLPDEESFPERMWRLSEDREQAKNAELLSARQSEAATLKEKMETEERLAQHSRNPSSPSLVLDVLPQPPPRTTFHLRCIPLGWSRRLKTVSADAPVLAVLLGILAVAVVVLLPVAVVVVLRGVRLAPSSAVVSSSDTVQLPGQCSDLIIGFPYGSITPLSWSWAVLPVGSENASTLADVQPIVAAASAPLRFVVPATTVASYTMRGSVELNTSMWLEAGSTIRVVSEGLQRTSPWFAWVGAEGLCLQWPEQQPCINALVARFDDGSGGVQQRADYMQLFLSAAVNEVEMVIPSSGWLMLSVWDGDNSDNDGHLTVSISLRNSQQPAAPVTTSMLVA